MSSVSEWGFDLFIWVGFTFHKMALKSQLDQYRTLRISYVNLLGKMRRLIAYLRYDYILSCVT